MADETQMDRLKLIALDKDDLNVLAPHVQDAILKVEDIRYSAANQQFILALRRFAWEKQVKGSAPNERRSAVLHFARVNRVQRQNLDLARKDTVLALLTIQFRPTGDAKDDPSGEIELVFAGGATIRLTVECIEAQLTDLQASWQATARPEHELDTSGKG